MPNAFPPTTPDSSTTIAVANAADAVLRAILDLNQTMTGIHSELARLRQTAEDLTKHLAPERIDKR